MTNPPIISVLSNLATIQSVSHGTGSLGTTGTPNMTLAMPPGSFLNGYVINRDRSGNPVLRTDKGDLVLKSEVFIKTGSEVVIKFEKAVNEVRARIMTIDGESFFNIQNKPQPQQKADMILNSSLLSPQEEAPADVSVKTTTPAKEALVRAVVVSALPLKPEQIQQLQVSTGLQNITLRAGTQLAIKIIASDTSQATLLQTINDAALSTLSDDTATIISKAPAPVSVPQMEAKYAAYQKQLSTPVSLSPATVPVTEEIPLPAQEGAAPPSPNPASLKPLATLLQTPATPTAPKPLPLTVSGTNQIQQPLPTAQAATPSVTTAPTPSSIPLTTPTLPLTAPISTLPIPETALTVAPTLPLTSTPAATASTIPAAPTTMLAANEVQAFNTLPVFTSGNQMQATVIGTEYSGETVLQTPIGTVKLPLEHSLPTGTRLVFELVSLEQPQTSATGTMSSAQSTVAPALLTANDATVAELARSWPAFSELVQALAQHDPTAARLLIEKSIPQIGRNFTNGVLFFISALRGGDVKQWLGQKNTNLLEQSVNGDLIRRVTSEFATLRNSFLTPADNNWQPVFLPLAYGNELTQARMYYKRDNSKGKDGKPAPHAGTRFIMEVDFSELGPIQMDGFVKKKEERTLFDLIIRTLKQLPDSMQHDITDIFNNAAKMTGFRGSVQIITGREFPINPLDTVLSERHGNLIA